MIEDFLTMLVLSDAYTVEDLPVVLYNVKERSKLLRSVSDIDSVTETDFLRYAKLATTDEEQLKPLRRRLENLFED